MLLSASDASVMAFEPGQHNLFYTSSSLHRLMGDMPRLAQRAILLPIGLGATASTASLYQAVMLGALAPNTMLARQAAKPFHRPSIPILTPTPTLATQPFRWATLAMQSSGSIRPSTLQKATWLRSPSRSSGSMTCCGH